MAELLAGLLIFDECRAHRYLTFLGCIEFDRVLKQMKLPSPCPRVCVLPSVVSAVCACTMSSVASSHNKGAQKDTMGNYF